MDRLWLITNPHSGSAAPEICEAIETVCAERGLSFAGRTRFPDESMPGPDGLGGADTVLLFAGDGTINAALRALDGWDGDILILPGGTMNMLAKRLHGDADPHTIIHTAHEKPRTVALESVAVGGARAYVGVIAGPVTAWAEAREAARAGEVASLPAAAAEAWTASWEGDVAVHDGDTLLGRYQSVFIEPDPRGIAVAGIAATGMADVARLGWSWLTGDWRDAANVDSTVTRAVTLTSDGGVSALVDGEPVTLESPATFCAATSKLKFVATLAPAPLP